MILGMPVYTFVHTLLSLIGLLAGLVVLIDLLGSRQRDGWALLLFVSIFATDATGFGFPVTHILPSHIVTVISLVILAVAVLARYTFRLRGAARWIYAVTAVLTFYLDVFVAVAQAFGKIPALQALAPIGSAPPFAVAELVVLVLFVVLAILAGVRFHPARPALSPT